jgi:hypothetical protein
MTDVQLIASHAAKVTHKTHPPAGGKRHGSGRKPNTKSPSDLKVAYDILDRAIPLAAQKLVDLMDSSNKLISLRAAERILDKRIPNVTQVEGLGGPSQVVVMLKLEGVTSTAVPVVTRPVLDLIPANGGEPPTGDPV